MRGCLGAVTVCVAVCFLAGAAVGAVPEQFQVWGDRAKSHPYLADAAGEFALAAPLAENAEEKARGFAVLSKPADFLLRPDFAPADADRCAALSARDCPGQYGSLTFAVLALAPAEISVSVTDLAGPGGRQIAAENFDVRSVRSIKVTAKGKAEVVPLLLEKAQEATLAAAGLRQFWITYYIPPATPPGTYSGKVRIMAGAAEKLSLPLGLTVYPFTLAEPGVNLYVYHNNSTEPADLPAIRKHLADQRCHGMTQATLIVPVTRDGELNREALGPLLDAYKASGLPGTHLQVGLWNRITAEWLNTPDASIKMYGQWFRYYPFSERLDKRYVEAVKVLRDEAKNRGLELVLAVADEAGSHPWTTEATQHYFDLVKREVPDVVRELSVGGGWAMKRPEDELWKGRIQIWTTNRWLQDKLDLVRAGDPKAVFQFYNMAGDGSAGGGIASVRAFFGFFLWKSGAAGAAQWTYYHTGTPACNYTWPAVDASQGHVPTLRWEMAREGAKDRRYLATLESRLARKGGPAVDEARKFLAETSARIILRTDQYDPVGGGRVPCEPPGTYDQWRSRIAELIQRF
ncbi:MAG: hypothetical protein NT049_10955 [Planctomycetota bacterium]|nr:hypothetical protein [Planctomycetota bacterium]